MKRLAVAATIILLSGVLLQGQSDSQRKSRLGEHLGRLSANKYAADSTSNRFGVYGSPYSAKSINNPYGYGSPYLSGKNSPALIAEDGTYLGRVNSNQYDLESIANPYGVYGSPYSLKSINNPYSVYGSPYSLLSPTNKYTLTAPKLFAPRTTTTPSFSLYSSPYRPPTYLLKKPSP